MCGRVNSTHVDGSRALNDIGRSGDFMRNAALSVITLSATTVGGDLSRIVPMVPHVHHTENDIDAVVTEHGVTDLRGTSPRERAELLVGRFVTPTHRDPLRTYHDHALQNGGHELHDLDSVFS